MCGICGFAGRGGERELRAMAARLVHRGPDAEGFWSDPARGLYLGHRRLSILDHAGGGQPMWSADKKLCVVFNGEIYNHLDLRRELSVLGHSFLTGHSDTEVLLHGYRQWGGKLCERLNGMWAFSVYDAAAGRLFLSRDRFGQKPLFYSLSNDVFAFASELDALSRHPAVDRTLSTAALKKYFAYGYIPAPYSIFRGAKKLPAGHNLVFDLRSRDMELSRWWRYVPEPFETVPADPEGEWGGRLRELLFAAVRRRLVADVPVGMLLSGGIDSSSVINFAISACVTNKVKTFSIGFNEESFDESSYSSAITDILGTAHELEVLSVDRAREIAPEIAARIDEPMGDNSLVPTYLLCEVARRKVTVALGGDGADELFAGYDPFRALAVARQYSRFVPRPVHKAVRMAVSMFPASHRNMSLPFRLNRALGGISGPERLWNPLWMAPLSPRAISELFGEKTTAEDLFSEAIEAWESCPVDDPVERTMAFFINLYLQDDILVKIDRASMLHGLELRSPYLDIELVDFVRRIPAAWKFRNGTTKYILKSALEPVLPLQILHRSKKGFGMPVGKWFKDGSLTVNAKAPAGGMSEKFITRRLARHRAGRADERGMLWNLWLLDAWAAART